MLIYNIDMIYESRYKLQSILLGRLWSLKLF